MADVLFVLLILVLFGLAGLLVAACDRIIGPAEERHDEEGSAARQRAAA
jgi:hypothetical protein